MTSGSQEQLHRRYSGQQAPPIYPYGPPPPQQPYCPPAQTSVYPQLPAEYYAPQPPPQSYGQPHAQPGPVPFEPPMAPVGVFMTDPELGGSTDSKLLDGGLPTYIRHAFIRKVYFILGLQLTVTFGIGLMFGFWPAAADYIVHNRWLYLTASIGAISLLIALVCCPGVAKSHPTNLILLFILSVCFGVLMGYLAAAVPIQTFLSAMGITLAVVIAVTVFACQVKYDFTGFAPFMLVAIICLIFFGIFAAIFRSRIVYLVYGCLGALVFSCYLVFDTQMIVGGKHVKHQFSIDDYILAAISLYIDVIQIFSYILLIMQSS